MRNGRPTVARSSSPRPSIPTARPSCPTTTAPAPSATPTAMRRPADSKVKAQIFTHLLYRHWNHYTGDKRSHLFLVSVESGEMRDLTPNDPHDVPPFSLDGGGGFAIRSRLEGTGLHREPRSRARHQHQRRHLHPRPDQPRGQAGQGQHVPRRRLQPRLLARRQISRMALARPAPATRADKFRLVLYDRAAKTTKDLLPNFDNWVDEFAWAPDSDSASISSRGNRGRGSDLCGLRRQCGNSERIRLESERRIRSAFIRISQIRRHCCHKSDSRSPPAEVNRCIRVYPIIAPSDKHATTTEIGRFKSWMRVRQSSEPASHSPQRRPPRPTRSAEDGILLVHRRR